MTVPDAPRRRGRPGHDQDAVLGAAVRLFNERGYDATSMFDVAESLGITKSSLYHHVSSKEQLLQLAVDRALDALFEAADEVRALPEPAIARLEQLIRRSVLVLAERLEFVTLLLRVRGNTEVEQRALQRRRLFDARVTALVKQAQAEGGVRPDVDPAAAARLLFGMVNSLTEWYRPRRGGAAVLAETVAALAFDGLRTRTAEPPSGEAEARFRQPARATGPERPESANRRSGPVETTSTSRPRRRATRDQPAGPEQRAGQE